MDINQMQFANGLQHHKKKKKKTSTKNNDVVTTFFSPVLFCGECTPCAAPPPAIGDVWLTDDDEESNIEAITSTANSSIRLRIDSGHEATGRMDVLRTLLMDLDGVTHVHMLPPPLASDSNVETNGSNANASSPPRVIRIDYNPSTKLSTTTSVISTQNPQEAKQKGSESDLVYQAIMSRLLEARFEYTVLPNDEEVGIRSDSTHKIHSISQLLPNKKDSSTTSKVKLTKSCRTRLRVSGICCSSEIPPIRAILKPLPGVRKLGVNVAIKMVYIDHDPTIITAELLAAALNEQRFGAEIETDGASSSLTTNGDDATQASSFESIMNLPRSKFVESTFVIPGLVTYTQDKMDTCPIGKVLRQNFFKHHIRTFHLHAQSQTLKVEHDPSLLTAERIYNTLVSGLKDDAWGRIELAHDGATEGLTLPVLSNERRDDNEGNDFLDEGGRRLYCFRGLKVNILLSGLCWILSLLSYVGDSWRFLQYAGIGAVFFGLPPVAMKAYLTMRRCQFDANCMMVTAALGSLALGEYDEAASVSFLFSISEWLEARATKKARRALGEIVSLRPDYANVIDPATGDIVIIPASNLPVGCRVSVRTGDKVPADGVVVEGTSSVDESSLTGEARPVEKHPGEEVSSGSINVGSSQLVIRTSSTVGDSALSRLIELIEEAQANASETEKLVDAFAKKYTPFVLVIAFCLCTVPWFFGEEVGRYWSLNGLIFIIIACPCALTISTPVTYSAGLAATAKRGIIIKGGSRLECLGHVKTVVFDKTGTLTTGRFSLSHLEAVGGSKSRKEILRLLAIMEAPSSHPLSACLVSAAKDEGVVLSETVCALQHTILKGEGVTATVDDERVYVGNARLFGRIGMYNIPQQYTDWAAEWSDEGGTVGYIGIEGVGIIGMYCVKDTIREEAPSVVSTLHQSDVEVIMLTGDGQGAARAVGTQIGLDESCIQSQLLPEDKLHYVSSLKGSSTDRHPSLYGGKKLILMVGDGVNDAPALTVADIGVAMGEGAALAVEMSDVTLMDSNLTKLLFSMDIGAKVIKTVKENIAFSIVVNLIAIVLTCFGKMTLLWAIVSDVGTMLLVTLNGMKLLSPRTIAAIERKQDGMLAVRTERKKDGERYENLNEVGSGDLELV
mmetsp:Transcript_18364/g.31061  ORF Transcript_18364/g.31061 Transcript_18364/m.31061 type:complete len:1128 (+) Transcript_18364:369-3752(+)